MTRPALVVASTLALSFTYLITPDGRAGERLWREGAHTIVEAGVDSESTIYATGESIVVPTLWRWRPFCGSDLGALTPEAFSEIVETAIAARDAMQGTEPEDGGVAGTSSVDVVFVVSNDPPGAQAAIDEVEAYLESLWTDPISFSININFAPLGGGVLGATGSSAVPNVAYTTVQAGLIGGMDEDDFIQTHLPAGTMPVRYDGNTGVVTNENAIDVNVATYRATIGTVLGSAASMTINSNTGWDYDPSNGITGGQFDFQSVLVHEVGHAMGFTSAADGANFMEILDVYRFQRTDGGNDYNPDDVAEFTTTPRLVDNGTPDDDHNSNLFDAAGTDIEYRMSDGSPSQASHFRSQSPAIGIMDPSIAPGESFWPDFFLDTDIDMLDAIGWDYAPETGTTTLPFFDDFPSTTIDNTLWTGVDGAASNTSGTNEPSPPNSLNLDGAAATGGDEVRSARMDGATLTDLMLTYHWQRTGGGNSPEAGEDLVVEYQDPFTAWIEVSRHPGDGPDMSTYTFETIALPEDASHDALRIRFRVESLNDGADDWFVDDIGLDGTVPPANNACATGQLTADAAIPFTTIGATTDGFSDAGVCGAGVDAESDIWFVYFVSCAGDLTIELTGLDYDAVLTVYADGACPTGPDEAIACMVAPGQTLLVLPVTSGTRRIRLGGVNDAEGSGTLNLNCSAGPMFCTTDCDGGGDGSVDVADLLKLLAEWGTAGPHDCDVDPAPGGDGAVDVGDLLALLAEWATPCTP